MFDIYAAFALVNFMGSGNDLEKSTSSRMMQMPVRQLFYSEQFGITLVSEKDTWQKALESYVGQIDTQVPSAALVFDLPLVHPHRPRLQGGFCIVYTVEHSVGNCGSGHFKK